MSINKKYVISSSDGWLTKYDSYHDAEVAAKLRTVDECEDVMIFEQVATTHRNIPEIKVTKLEN